MDYDEIRERDRVKKKQTTLTDQCKPQFQNPKPKLRLLLMLNSLRDYENEKKMKKA